LCGGRRRSSVVFFNGIQVLDSSREAAEEAALFAGGRLIDLLDGGLDGSVRFAWGE